MVANVLQITGLGIACVGVMVFSLPAGLVAFGAACFWVGIQIERSK